MLLEQLFQNTDFNDVNEFAELIKKLHLKITRMGQLVGVEGFSKTWCPIWYG